MRRVIKKMDWSLSFQSEMWTGEFRDWSTAFLTARWPTLPPEPQPLIKKSQVSLTAALNPYKEQLQPPARDCNINLFLTECEVTSQLKLH